MRFLLPSRRCCRSFVVAFVVAGVQHASVVVTSDAAAFAPPSLSTAAFYRSESPPFAVGAARRRSRQQRRRRRRRTAAWVDEDDTVGGLERRSFVLVTAAKKENEEDRIIDAIIEEEVDRAMSEEKEASSTVAQLSTEVSPRIRKRDVVRKALKRLASLSLKDYQWRSSVFKRNEADRKVEESLARMMGEDPSYVRPMDAAEGKIGPLGEAEKKAVTWLSSVIEEEGKRAEAIANSDGDLIRPIDLDPTGAGGPLAAAEKSAVKFVNRIVDSETERWKSGVIRPKDLDETKRGPLGDAEAKAVSALKEISASEKLRMDQSRLRGGEVVRPIDVPGPLGELERAVVDAMSAERQRAKDRKANEGRLVRPKDATLTGPLGEAERKATEAVERLKEEEKERLKNVNRFLNEKRPMEADRDSPLGITEAVTVGLFRGPKLAMKVIDRVKELMRSEELESDDKDKLKLPPKKSDSDENEAKP